jgi:phosphate transport system permease protein
VSTSSITSPDLSKILASRRRQDRLFNLLGIGCTLFGVAALSALLIKLCIDGAAGISWFFLTEMEGQTAAESGILASLVGSGLVMLVTALTAVPLGIAAGD